MKITIAIDSFKGSMTSIEAGNAAKEGILKVQPNAEVTVFPVADGGEGTLEALAFGKQAVRKREISVTGPLGDSITASYITYESENTKAAVIEMASAAGLALVPEEKRNPMYTTTYGVGEMIRDAVKQGCRQFIIGIGGSATNDGGVGMLQALGYQFVDSDGENISFGAEGLALLQSIRFETVIPELKNCNFRVMCDVKNPLLGPDGCSTVFGPQKGADPSMIRKMEQGMKRYADLVEDMEANGKGRIRTDVNQNYPGSGAAGGLGYAFLMFLNARLERGIGVILQEIGIESSIQACDFVITGEGKLDAQTLMGKTPAGVAALAKKYKKKVFAFAGCIGEGAEACRTSGLMDEYYAITDLNAAGENERQSRLQFAMQKENAMQNMREKVAEVFTNSPCN
ncbi:MAG: glycerate kinase [Lachnospiraceae bacterium]